MHITIMVDKNSSEWDEKDFEFNKLFVIAQQMYIVNRYRCQGYIYLNVIYELLGLNWNPHNENICWIYERDGELEISIILTDISRNKIGFDILYKL